MPVFTDWYVTVVLEVAGKERSVRGPNRETEDEAKSDLKELQETMGSGNWINLEWISADPRRVVAAHVDHTSIGFA